VSGYSAVVVENVAVEVSQQSQSVVTLGVGNGFDLRISDQRKKCRMGIGWLAVDDGLAELRHARLE
jgi:hypothetical protein